MRKDSIERVSTRITEAGSSLVVDSRGFTLVELMLVVLIIAVLSAIAIPQFNAYKKRGYAATLNSDVKNAYTAAMAYYAANPTIIAVPTCNDLYNAGYSKSSGVTCADANVTVTTTGAGSITLTGAAAWGLTTNQASINGNGVLTPAVP